MSARILSPDRLAERRPSRDPVVVEALLDRAGGVCSWLGASGQRYAHSIFSLIECPPLPKAMYLLVHRNKDGRRQVLHIGCGQDEAPTLNLARVRQRGAQLGANEVHVHFLAETEPQRRLVTCDLRAGQFGELCSEPTRAHH